MKTKQKYQWIQIAHCTRIAKNMKCYLAAITVKQIETLWSHENKKKISMELADLLYWNLKKIR